MSFFGKFKGGAGTPGLNGANAPTKKDPNAPQPTKLEKHLNQLPGPVRTDGSDKYFGFENYGSTCYSNSIIQCLYYSAPFRTHVINFPPHEYVHDISSTDANGAPLSPRSTSSTPWPNVTSPARKQPPTPGTPAAQGKPEETKDSPEYLKRMALQSGPVLDMIHDNSNKYGMEESLFTALKDIFDAIISNSSRKGVVSPHKFLEILRRENEMFRSAMHQDAHEFLNLLLNEVVENVEAFSKQRPMLNGVLANGAAPEKDQDGAISSAVTSKDAKANAIDTRWVHDLFEGLLTSETRCLTCENLSQRDEPFLDLSVDLSAHTSVTSCLRKFSEEEMLCERNKFHCDNCGGLQEAEKRMKIKRLPRVLALHLKRFKYTEDLQRLQKLFHRVVYPFHLRLFNTTDDAQDPDRLYELYAVVVHIGGGPYHGHYVSIIKTQDQRWFLFDDELVEPVDKSYVLNFFGGEPIPGLQDAKQLACAYVLFYQETTLEAVLKEQEMEGQEPLQTRVSDVVEPVKEVPLAKNAVHATTTPIITSSLPEEPNGTETLARAVTSPTIASPTEAPAPLEPIQTTPITVEAPTAAAAAASPSPIIKSKKELKAEEKEKKAAAKAAEKALEDKRREASKKRIEAWLKQDEELKNAIDASRQTASEEAATRGGNEQLHGVLPREGGGMLSRFRTGSLSRKSRFLAGGAGGAGGGERDVSSGGEKLRTVPQEASESAVVTGDGASAAAAAAGEAKSPAAATPTTTAAAAAVPAVAPAPAPSVAPPPPAPAAPPTPVKAIKSPVAEATEVKSPTIPVPPEEKSKWHRFSLGKKRSQGLTSPH